MKREVFERRFPHTKRAPAVHEMIAPSASCLAMSSMGLAPGGRMKQQIYRDPFAFSDWDLTARSRCFVHIANSLVWEAITGSRPPAPPITAKSYSDHGLPWFDYYLEGATALEGAEALRRLRSVIEMAREKGDPALPENDSVAPDRVVRIQRTSAATGVREGEF
jgi:hypothetical protein